MRPTPAINTDTMRRVLAMSLLALVFGCGRSDLLDDLAGTLADAEADAFEDSAQSEGDGTPGSSGGEGGEGGGGSSGGSSGAGTGSSSGSSGVGTGSSGGSSGVGTGSSGAVSRDGASEDAQLPDAAFVCTPENCAAGCCFGDICAQGDQTIACGTGGGACAVCPPGWACVGGGCIGGPQ